ncbi:nonsense-mediated mRNA decay factor SMG7 isoform X2 [Hevea brasiliensis]|nr:nonsense-mediated mRNA decay factor SMG7 isoform X2 [Hevea brasiliensis]
MDKMSAPSSRERAQHLYEKVQTSPCMNFVQNIEFENKRRRSAQARIPSDPNAWQQMRENYEAIILEDHGFSEQHNIEYVLWQLHYRRIEELRAHFSAALANTGSNTSQGVKVPARPDRITKIRLQFKTFLSEATGFYHDLILKIRAKYGLPLGYFSEDSDNRVVLEKDGKKSANMKKGLISCHRCLIYLGDLARYKGLYGEGESKTREYAAASSYYLQAASLWPSSGNPHHQLAILASYSGDELVAVYRYFRSLAVDNPFTTARDNLIVAFEKNRQSYTQLLGDVNGSVIKDSSVRKNSKGRGKVEAKLAVKDTNMEANVVNERTSNIREMYKSFCIQFVWLNGILFTRTSLETFAEVLSSVIGEFCELLSSGPEEQLNFGADAVENALFIVRLISILIFTVHNVKREALGQTYAEIVQRAVLLQNALTAVFELMGHMLERFVQLQDPSSCYLLPGILVFVEWLACCPDVASGSDADEKQANVRLKFWNYFISFLNKILSFWSMSLDDNEDDTCFYNMSHYEEGETGNRLALWEDFELRGFLPVLPAQTILDFSGKHSFGSEGSKEKIARVKRILAAGKALANIARVDQKTIFYDSRMKKFVIGVEPQISDDSILNFDPGLQKTNDVMQEIQPQKTINLGVLQPNAQPYIEGDEEDEVIVFRPAVTEKQNDGLSPKWAPYDGMKPSQDESVNLKFYGGSVSSPHDVLQHSAFDAVLQISASTGIIAPQHLQPIQPPASKWLMEEAALLANSLKAVRFMENGHVNEHELPKDLGMANPTTHSLPIQQPANVNGSMFYNQAKVPEAVIPSKIDFAASSGVIAESLAVKTSAALPAGLRKSPVSRPVRHLGPPPGFGHGPLKQVNEIVTSSDLMSDTSLTDDYSWLDGYQLPSSTKGSGLNNTSTITSQAMSQYVNSSNGLTGTLSFPFPGKQVPSVQLQTEKQKVWHNYQPYEHLSVQQEQQLQQQLLNGNQQFTTMPEQYHGNSIWGGHYIV